MRRRLTPVVAVLALVLGGTAAAAASQASSVADAQGQAAKDRVPPRIVPAPATMATLPESPFIITPETRIAVPDDAPDAVSVAAYLADILRRSTGYPIPVVPGGDAAGAIALDLAGPGGLGSEAYSLTVHSSGVRLSAATAEGLFRGVQTMRQLLPPQVESASVQPGPWPMQTVRIIDHPRFDWRGGMLDPARHFLTVGEVKRYIDLISLYKINVLHLHLTDDQGWRIQIDGWPRLTTVGGSTDGSGGPGGYYTKADYREIVQYAADRYITIVPEIEFPGHTGAMLRAYPELCPDTGCRPSEELFAFLDDVIGEVAEMTPGPYIHIGGDETFGTTPEDYIQYLERAEDIVYAHGKRMIGWGEIANTPLRDGTVAQYWGGPTPYPPDAEGLARIAADEGAPLIMSPADRVYLDMKYDPSTPVGLDWAGYVEAEQSYSWDPATRVDGVGEQDVLGIEAPLWGETVRNIDDAELLTFPRLPGAAEVGWSPRYGRAWDEYRLRLATQGLRWDVMGINYHRSPQVPWGLPVFAEMPEQLVYDDAGRVSLPVELTNAAPSVAGDVTVRLELPDGGSAEPEQVELGSLAAGASRTVRFDLGWPDAARAREVTPIVTISWLADGDRRTNVTSPRLRATCAAEPTSPAALTYVDSEELVGEGGNPAANLIDGDPATFWHTEWLEASPPHPHEVQVDLGQPTRMCAVRYLPRQSGANGTIADYEIYLSDDGETWGDPVAAGEFSSGRDEKWVPITETTARYVRFVALSEVNGNPWASGAELSVDAAGDR
jgi:hexosaminidase